MIRPVTPAACFRTAKYFLLRPLLIMILSEAKLPNLFWPEPWPPETRRGCCCWQHTLQVKLNITQRKRNIILKGVRSNKINFVWKEAFHRQKYGTILFLESTSFIGSHMSIRRISVRYDAIGNGNRTGILDLDLDLGLEAQGMIAQGPCLGWQGGCLGWWR